jgi:hypothetical protein
LIAVIQIIITILSSAVKFAMTFPLAVMQFKFSFYETILWTNVGGILGIYFFAFLSEKAIVWWARLFRNKRADRNNNPREKKIFTKKNRRIIRIKQRYGLIGIAITTPFLLSIPLGTFLVVRYYKTSKVKFTYLIASNLVWSAIYTVFYMFWDGLLFKRG